MLDHHPLPAFLDLAVSVALMDLQVRGGPTDQDFDEARAFGITLAEKGDTLLFGDGRRKREPGELGPGKLATGLAKSIAVMSYLPGGITAFGRKWETPGVEKVEVQDD